MNTKKGDDYLILDVRSFKPGKALSIKPIGQTDLFDELEKMRSVLF